MSEELTMIGHCPMCEEIIPHAGLIIEYQRNHTRAVYAECPECLEVVNPV